MVRFLADECTFASTVRLLRKLGFYVQRVQELNLVGAEDGEIFEKAQQLQAVLITNDRGFEDVRAYPPSSHRGIIVLKMEPDPDKVQAVHRVLEKLLQQESQFERRLFIVDMNKYRKRTKP